MDPLLNKQRFFDTVAQKGGTILSEYFNYSTKIDIQCPSGHVWAVTPSHVANGGSWCPKCPKITAVKSKEKFLTILAEKSGTLLSEYVNTNTHVRVRCHLGHEWDVIPHSIVGVMNSWYPACSNNCPKQAAERFYAKVKEKGGIALQEYEGSHAAIRIRCAKGHEWVASPIDITSSKSWCAKCSNLCPEQAKEKFIQTVISKGGTVLGEYINAYTRVRVRCKDGHEWDSVPGSVNFGDWCRACAGHCPIEAYKRLCEIVELNNGEILDPYVNSQTKMRFRCKFGHIWETCPTNITNSNCWCTGCGESHGARTVRSFLEKRNIEFETEKNHPLTGRCRYDFYFTYEGKEFYVEYDGGQHFYNNGFHTPTEEEFQHRRELDVLKTKAIVESGCYIIRLDDTLGDHQIETHMVCALQGNEKLYVSNKDMYAWILEGMKSIPLISPIPPKMVILNVTPRVPPNVPSNLPTNLVLTPIVPVAPMKTLILKPIPNPINITLNLKVPDPAPPINLTLNVTN